MIAKAIRIEGKVQGVGFRYYILKNARAHRINGWVKNTPDCALEVQAIGNEMDMDVFLDYCQQGPPQSRVEKISTSTLQNFVADEFIIRR
jgi:acylphosphatase